MAKINFNPTEVPEDEGFQPIPEGEYLAQIVQSEMKNNKAGTGQYLELRVQILEEPYVGRLVFERLNLINPNETAVRIANRTLADICEACGMGDEEIEDSEDLHGIEFIAKLKVTEAKGEFPPGNEVKKYKAA